MSLFELILSNCDVFIFIFSMKGQTRKYIGGEDTFHTNFEDNRKHGVSQKMSRMRESKIVKKGPAMCVSNQNKS